MNQTQQLKEHCNYLILSGCFGEIVQKDLLLEFRGKGISISPIFRFFLNILNLECLAGDGIACFVTTPYIN